MKEKVFNHVQKLLQHELITGSFYIFMGGMIASVLNFLFNLFLIRHLTHEDYGTYAAIISLIALLAIPAQAITPTIIRFATEYIAKDELGKAKRFYKQSSLFLLIVGLIIAVALIIFSPFINNFFKLDNKLYLLSAGIIILITYVSVINGSYIQSLLRFKFLSLVNIINSLSKLVFGGILIFIGFQVIGAVGGIIIGGLLGFIFSLKPILYVLRQKKEVAVGSHLKEIGQYSILAAISMFALASFTSTDILLVKHFFSTTDAGLYAGLALLGKIIFYFSSPITTVMFPILVNRFHRGQKTRNTLYLAVLLVFLPSLLLSILYTIFPSFFVALFLGGRGYLQISQYVGLYGLYIALFSVANILTNYFLSMQYALASYVVGVAAILQIIGIILFHDSFQEIISISIGILLVVCIVLPLILLRTTKRT